jgi:hypothetical protein
MGASSPSLGAPARPARCTQLSNVESWLRFFPSRETVVHTEYHCPRHGTKLTMDTRKIWQSPHWQLLPRPDGLVDLRDPQAQAIVGQTALGEMRTGCPIALDSGDLCSLQPAYLRQEFGAMPELLWMRWHSNLNGRPYSPWPSPETARTPIWLAGSLLAPAAFILFSDLKKHYSTVLWASSEWLWYDDMSGFSPLGPRLFPRSGWEIAICLWEQIKPTGGAVEERAGSLLLAPNDTQSGKLTIPLPAPSSPPVQTDAETRSGEKRVAPSGSVCSELEPAPKLAKLGTGEGRTPYRMAAVTRPGGVKRRTSPLGKLLVSPIQAKLLKVSWETSPPVRSQLLDPG